MPQQEAVESTEAERTGELRRSGSSSRLNAQAPEFVPRGPPPPVIRVFAASPPPPRAAFFAVPPPPPLQFEYYAPVGGRGGFAAKESKPEPHPESEVDNPPALYAETLVEGLPDEVVHKIIKQVEYYFSDINLATTEHLMRFISKDPGGYVPMSVIAGFKKIRALVHSNLMLAAALQNSSKLVVSEDGKRIKRQEPFTESYLQELQSRIVVAENLPGDPSYQNLKKIFSAVGSVVSIRTCYPQTANGTGPATNRSSKLDMLFANKLHAFVEYETPEDAEKAIFELNDEGWRNGLRVRLLDTCTTQGVGKGKKGVPELDGNGDEDVSTSNQSTEKQTEESSQLLDALPEHLFDDNLTDKEAPRRGKGLGRGGRGRGRGFQQHNNNHHGNNRGGGSNHRVGTPPNNQPIKPDQPQQSPTKQPPGPHMPDGTRGFTMGRGKLLPTGSCPVGGEP